MVVAFPNGDLSYYCDLASGPAYAKYIGEELPRFLSHNFPISSQRKDNFIAGFSMGGYGAFRTALTRPHRYAAAGSFSGALDVVARYQKSKNQENQTPQMKAVFGDNLEISGTDNDLFHLLSRQKSGKAPKLWLRCGKDDFLYQDNLSFCKAAKGKNVDLTQTFVEGSHNWDYIDKNLPDFINWLKPLFQKMK